jgi:large subunit ribosomal protein L4
MPSVDIFDLNNDKVGSLDLADAVFGVPVNEALLYESVRHYMACQRGGNASTKTRHEVSGSGKKLWKQKGTGRARVGSIRSPLWRHGGTTHGPQPKDYGYKLPRKMVLGALRSALSAKLADGELKVVREFSLSDHKTRTLASALSKLETPKTVLLVDVIVLEEGKKHHLTLGARNLEGVKLVPTHLVTTYDLLRHKQVVISAAAAQKLSEALA